MGACAGRERVRSPRRTGRERQGGAEVLFVHRYSGGVSGSVSGFIGTFYALLSALIIGQQGAVEPHVYSSGASDAILSTGLLFYAIGQAGNFYHHVLLSQLRDPKAEAPVVQSTPSQTRALSSDAPAREYKLPKGGLFELVTTPHYTFEVVAWIGISLCTQQLNALLVAAGMGSYLSGRAAATTTWYRQQFGSKAVPPGRKHIVPFIF